MKLFSLALLSYFVLSALISCSSSNNKIETQIKPNDTTEIFRLLIDSELVIHPKHFIGENLNSSFGDTIIFQYDSLFGKYFIGIKNRKFKIMSKNEISDFAFNRYNNKSGAPFPHFIQIVQFQKTDTSYVVVVSVKWVFPNFDKEGNPLKQADGRIYSGKEKCTISENDGFTMVVKRQNGVLKEQIKDFTCD